jgi:hypothetical protein
VLGAGFASLSCGSFGTVRSRARAVSGSRPSRCRRDVPLEVPRCSRPEGSREYGSRAERGALEGPAPSVPSDVRVLRLVELGVCGRGMASAVRAKPIEEPELSAREEGRRGPFGPGLRGGCGAFARCGLCATDGMDAMEGERGVGATGPPWNVEDEPMDRAEACLYGERK